MPERNNISPAAPAAPVPAPASPPPAIKPAVLAQTPLPREIGGASGPDPTRYGDWERAGRCIDF
ncbi:MAG: DUF1674 domain-containing protein [Steroidobacteraceae bacterium]